MEWDFIPSVFLINVSMRTGQSGPPFRCRKPKDSLMRLVRSSGPFRYGKQQHGPASAGPVPQTVPQRDAHPSLVTGGSVLRLQLSRVRFAAHKTRALDSSGRATRASSYEPKGSWRNSKSSGRLPNGLHFWERRHIKKHPAFLRFARSRTALVNSSDLKDAA